MKNKFYSKLLFFIEESLRDTDEGKSLELTMNENGILAEHLIDNSRINIIFTPKSKSKKFSPLKNKIIIYQNEIDFKALDKISELLQSILSINLTSALSYKLKNSEKMLEVIKSKNLSSQSEVIGKVSLEIEMITEIELILLRENDIEKWSLLFRNFFKKNHLFTHVGFVTEKEIFSDDSVLDLNSYIFQLPIRGYFLIIKDKNIVSPEDEFKLEFLVLIVLRSMHNLDYLESSDVGEIEFWKKIFSKIPYPMAVISQLGELLIYNEHFATVGILPKECLSYKDNEHVEIRQQHYKIKRFNFSFHENNVNYFIFYTSEKLMNNPNNELGIISSSIAHELNNPLAGILAALSLVRLENDWTDEAILEIEEMKNGAKRCKELVEIFLGFSRLSPRNSGESSLKLSLDQAVNLLRFRMIESDLRIDMKLNSNIEDVSFFINSSVLSMILYLILSELMTAFAHHRLLIPKSITHLDGTVIGSTHQVQFLLNEDFDYEKNILDSKLLQHLLFFEKLEIVFLKKEIRLIKIYK